MSFNYLINVLSSFIVTMEAFSIIKKGRGRVLLHSGYQYYVNRQYADGSVIWRCSYRSDNKYNCVGNLKIKDGVILKFKEHNNCQPDHAKNVVAEKLEECKQKLLNSDCTQTIPKFYEESVQSIKDSGIDLICKVPNFSSIKSTLYNTRNKGAGIPKFCFVNPSEVIISPRYSSFLIGDYRCMEVRIIVFCLEEMKERVASLTHFFGDGTFKSCPKPFKQLYTIHADFNSTEQQTNIFPIFYAFMSDMSKKSYKILFQMIKAQIDSWCPKKFTLDFEEAPRSAIVSVFPDIITNGCYYHFNRCIWRKAKEFQIPKNKWAKRIVKLCSVLPLVPRPNVAEAWEYIKWRVSLLTDDYKKVLERFFNYMENYWFKDEHFIDIWCIFDQRHRTTNSLEGWHFNLNNKCKKNINLVQLLQILHLDAKTFAIKVKKVENGQIIKKRLTNNINNDNIVMETQLQLLHGQISVNLYLEIIAS